MSMKKILITGANRGIGIELTIQYLNAGEFVIATCRNPENSEKLNGLKKIHNSKLLIVQMDVSNEDSIIESVSKVRKEINSIDLLINNAGTNSEQEKGLLTLDMNDMKRVFSVNTFGPVIISKHYLGLLSKGENPIIVNIFSSMGFITNREFESNAQYSYGASKAALNMCIKYMAADLKEKGISVIGLGPGFVLTDLTRNSPVVPSLTPEESVKNMIQVLKNVTLEDTGRFFENDGRKVEDIVNY